MEGTGGPTRVPGSPEGKPSRPGPPPAGRQTPRGRARSGLGRDTTSSRPHALPTSLRREMHSPALPPVKGTSAVTSVEAGLCRHFRGRATWGMSQPNWRVRLGFRPMGMAGKVTDKGAGPHVGTGNKELRRVGKRPEKEGRALGEGSERRWLSEGGTGRGRRAQEEGPEEEVKGGGNARDGGMTLVCATSVCF